MGYDSLEKWRLIMEHFLECTNLGKRRNANISNSF